MGLGFVQVARNQICNSLTKQKHLFQNIYKERQIFIENIYKSILYRLLRVKVIGKTKIPKFALFLEFFLKLFIIDFVKVKSLHIQVKSICETKQ